MDLAAAGAGADAAMPGDLPAAVMAGGRTGDPPPTAAGPRGAGNGRACVVDGRSKRADVYRPRAGGMSGLPDHARKRRCDFNAARLSGRDSPGHRTGGRLGADPDAGADGGADAGPFYAACQPQSAYSPAAPD